MKIISTLFLTLTVLGAASIAEAREACINDRGACVCADKCAKGETASTDQAIKDRCCRATVGTKDARLGGGQSKAQPGGQSAGSQKPRGN